MNLRILAVVPLLVACGGARFESPDPEETISTESDPEDVLVDETDTDDGTDTDVAETGESFATDTDGFEGAEVPGHEATDVETDVEETDIDEPVETDVDGTDEPAETDVEETDEPELVDPLLDDFEDGDERVHDADGRAAAGRWSFQATTLTNNGYVDLLTGESLVEAYSLGYGAHLVAEELLGADAEAWIAGSVSHSGRGYAPAADFEGIQFSACGVGAIRFGVDTVYRRAVATEQGELVEYKRRVELTDTWQVFEIRWEQLEETPGHEGSFNPAQFTGVLFHIDYPWESGGELWLDDVAFLGGDYAGIEGSPCPL